MELLMLQENSKSSGPAMMYYQFEDPGDMPYCFKYDAYIDFVPLSKPINAPALFGGDTGPESKITPGEEFLVALPAYGLAQMLWVLLPLD